MYKQLLTALLLFLNHHPFAQPTLLGQRTFHFIDDTRNRPVVTEVWYPTEDTLKTGDRINTPFVRYNTVRDGRLPSGKLPLIMLSHGNGGGRLTLEWLAQGLAESGFIVAAVDHWGNTYENPIPIEFLKPWQRPLDISFALTALLADPAVGPIIDRDRIGAIGFSYGGYTVLALAGVVLDYPAMIHAYKTTNRKELELPEMPGLIPLLDDSALQEQIKHIPVVKDRRIKAFFAISPGCGPGVVRAQQVAGVQDALYITGSQSDSMAPVRTNAAKYHGMIAGSHYYEFPGKVGHYVMLGEADEALKKRWPTGFVDDPSVDRHAVHLKADSLAVDFFKQHL